MAALYRLAVPLSRRTDAMARRHVETGFAKTIMMPTNCPPTRRFQALRRALLCAVPMLLAAPMPSSGQVQGPPDGLIAPPPANTPPISTPPRIAVPQAAPAPIATTPAAPAPAPTPLGDGLPPARPLAVPRQGGPGQAVPRVAPGNAAPRRAAPVQPTIGPVRDTAAVPVALPDAPAASAESPAPVLVDAAADAAPATDGALTPIDGGTPPETTPEWLPLAALGGLTVLGAGFALWRRRKRAVEADVHAVAPLAAPVATGKVECEVAPHTVVPDPQSQTPSDAPSDIQADTLPGTPLPAPAARPITGRRADIIIAFEPLSAQATLINFRLRYAITLTNEGSARATPVLLRIGMFAGTNAHPQGVAQWYGQPVEPDHLRVEAIDAGGHYRFEGELAVPLDALNPLVIEGRSMAIPLIAIDARYHHGSGDAPLDGQTARAFVIGRDPGVGTAKLAPFRLDQGATSFAPLGQRDTGISKTE